MSVFPTNSSELTNLFHTLARKLKANGECKLSGNSLLDRFADARGYSNKRTICALLDKESSTAVTQGVFSPEMSKLLSATTQATAQDFLSELIEYITKTLTHEFTQDEKLAPNIIEAALFVKDGKLSASESIQEWLWDDFDDGDGYIIAENFDTEIRPLLLADMAYELAEHEWVFNSNHLYAMGIEDNNNPTGTAERSQDFSRDFRRDCIREIYPVAFEDALVRVSKNLDRREPRIELSKEELVECATLAAKQLFSLVQPVNNTEPF